MPITPEQQTRIKTIRARAETKVQELTLLIQHCNDTLGGNTAPGKEYTTDTDKQITYLAGTASILI